MGTAEDASSEAGEPAPEPDLLSEDAGETDRIRGALVRELGEEMADAFVASRRGQEAWYAERRPDEGLRERKKRITRQQISDVATALFIVRGFDNVRVADVAAVVGVSEKTVYNYFPTKESMVFDQADEGLAQLAEALRDREPGQSPTMAVIAALEEDLDHFVIATSDANAYFFTTFGEMVRSHPSLRAAWLELQERFVAVTIDELASSLGVDPRDPEPVVAARALVGLQEIFFSSLERHVSDGHHGDEVRALVMGDLQRAAHLLDTGLWSLEWVTHGAKARAQLRESAKAAERAGAQVIAAVRQARATWQALKGDSGECERKAGPGGWQAERDASRAQWQSHRDAARAEREAARAHWQSHRDAARVQREVARSEWQAKRDASRAGREAWRAAREAQSAAMDAARAAQEAALQGYADGVGEPAQPDAETTRGRARGARGKLPKR